MRRFDDRADTETIGHIIILGITILGISMITLYGVPAIYRLQDMANLKNTEQAFTVLDSRASRAALGEAPRQVTEINLGEGSFSVVPNSSSEPSYILVELKNVTGVMYGISVPTGKIVYRLGDREVGYEGGGVFSKYPSGSVMVSPPEFHYNGITLTLPVITISGNSSTGGRGSVSLNLEKMGNAQRIYPNATYQNPIPENITYVNITIRSDYYDAWENYFKSIPLTNVYADPNQKKVTVTLMTPPVATNFTYGALASDEIILYGYAEIDSYNSSKGSYLVSKSGNGSIRAAEEIELKSNSKVNGSAMSSGVIEGSGIVMKDAYASSFDTVIVLGNKYPAVKGLSAGSTTSLVQGKMTLYATTNNNNNISAGGCLKGAGNKTLDSSGWTSPCTMSTGNYYLTEFTLETGDKLIFDTTLGGINIAVDSDITLYNTANITVIGSYPVKIYTNDDIELKDDVEVNHNANDTSFTFQIISSSDEDLDFKNGVRFCGIVWAPDAKIIVSNSGGIFGALVGKNFDLKNSQRVHYDEALQNLNTDLGSGASILYLHITRNNLGVSIS